MLRDFCDTDAKAWMVPQDTDIVGTNWLQKLRCQGHEATLLDCTVHDLGRNHICDQPSVAAGVTCKTEDQILREGMYRDCPAFSREPKEGDTCLFGGVDALSGRLGFYHNGSWGTVCGDFFGPVEATVVCRQLGYSSKGKGYHERSKHQNEN
jgi:deleted-in-malignant-brain-tumors protein 1